jgi:hypothetical protein
MDGEIATLIGIRDKFVVASLLSCWEPMTRYQFKFNSTLLRTLPREAKLSNSEFYSNDQSCVYTMPKGIYERKNP